LFRFRIENHESFFAYWLGRGVTFKHSSRQSMRFGKFQPEFAQQSVLNIESLPGNRHS
jgi:hypothetical protein